jgi:hypothetical protein
MQHYTDQIALTVIAEIADAHYDALETKLKASIKILKIIHYCHLKISVEFISVDL